MRLFVKMALPYRYFVSRNYTKQTNHYGYI